MTEYESGSYVVAVYKNGEYKDVYPVVVQGYELTVDTPSRTSAGAELNVTVTTEKITDIEDPSAVKVFLTTDDQTIQVTGTNNGTGEYHATIPLSDFQPGEARLYAVVHGSETAFKDGRKEVLGISTAATLTIPQPTTQTTTDASDPAPPTTTTAQPHSETSSTPGAPRTTTTTPANATPTPTTTSEPLRSPTTSEVTQPSETNTTATNTPTPGPGTTTVPTTESAVITPAPSTSTTPAPAGQGIPGFGLPGSVIALCCVFLLLRRR